MQHARITAFIGAEAGSVAIEYGTIAAAMCLAISPAFYYFKDAIIEQFELIASYLAAG